MVKKPSKRAMRWILAGIGVAIVAFIGVRYAIKKRNALPEGIASGNGRLEGKLVDVSAKEPLRVKEMLVDEGALVKPGQVLARLDTITLESELAEANAAVQAAEEKLAGAKANIVKSKSEIDLAGVEAVRSKRLVEQGKADLVQLTDPVPLTDRLHPGLLDAVHDRFPPGRTYKKSRPRTGSC